MNDESGCCSGKEMEGGCCCGDDGQGKTGKEETPEEALQHEDFFTGFNFSALILSLSTSVLVNLGELPDPLSNEKGINLPLAKQTISVIEMLEGKTKGNLNADEERLINNMLYDLRMKYVEAARK